MKESDSRYRHD